MSSKADHYTIIEYKGVKKRTHWKGHPTVKDFINLMESLFKVNRKSISPESIWISFTENGTGLTRLNLREFFDRKLMSKVGNISISVGTQVQLQQAESKQNQIKLPHDGKPKGTTLVHSLTSKPNRLKERASHPAESKFKQGNIEKSPVAHSVTHHTDKGGNEDNMSLKSSNLLNDNQQSIANSQDGVPIDRITLQGMQLGTIYPLLGKMNKVIVLHTVKSHKVAKNIFKLVPLSGREIPRIIYNRVATPQEESLELNVNNVFCFILKVNDLSLIIDIHNFIESLNMPNTIEHLIQKLEEEGSRSQILIEPATMDEFILLIKNAGCTRDQFLEILSSETGKAVSQGLLDLILSVCFELYKFKTAQLVQKFSLKEAEPVDIEQSIRIREELIALTKLVLNDIDLSVDNFDRELPRQTEGCSGRF